MKSITFTVQGIPAPKGSARAAGNHVIPSGSQANRDSLKSWGQRMHEAAARAVDQLLGVGNSRILFMGVPLKVTLEFRLPRPLSHFHRKGELAGQVLDDAPTYVITKPDNDKMIRSTSDEMIKMVFDDDSRIAWHNVRKVYALPGKEGAWVKIEQLEDKEPKQRKKK